VNAYEFVEQVQSAVEDAPGNVETKVAVVDKHGNPFEVRDVYYDDELDAVVVDFK